MKITENISGFVLAGGQSRRMGQDKGLLKMADRTMVESAIEALKPICSSVTILANNDSYDDFGYSVHSDLIEHKGPLAGLFTGLYISRTELNLFVTCDSPFVSTELLSYLADNIGDNDGAIPAYRHKIYPLTGVYKKSCSNAFQKRLKQNKLRVRDAIRTLNINEIEVSPSLPFFTRDLLANINTPEDLKRYENNT